MIERRIEQQQHLRFSRATRDVRTASMARSAKGIGTAPDRTAHDCEIESMLHSSLCAEPSGVPSS